MAEVTIRQVVGGYVLDTNQPELRELKRVPIKHVKKDLLDLLRRAGQQAFLIQLFNAIDDRKRVLWLSLLKKLIASAKEAKQFTITFVDETQRDSTREKLTLPKQPWLEHAVGFASAHDLGRGLYRRQYSRSRGAGLIFLGVAVIGASMAAGYPLYQLVHEGAKAATQALTQANPWVVIGLVLCVAGVVLGAGLWGHGYKRYCRKESEAARKMTDHLRGNKHEPDRKRWSVVVVDADDDQDDELAGQLTGSLLRSQQGAGDVASDGSIPKPRTPNVFADRLASLRRGETAEKTADAVDSGSEQHICVDEDESDTTSSDPDEYSL